MKRLQRYGIDYEAFYEPDNDLGLTAVSTYPIQNKKQRKAMGIYHLWSPEVCYMQQPPNEVVRLKEVK